MSEIAERMAAVANGENPSDAAIPETQAEKFNALLDDIRELHARKQSDYGTDEDAFANIRASEEFGIPAWLGAIVRGNDKVSRLKTFAKRGVLKNESVEDSLLDLATYSLIALLLFREANNEGEDA